MDVCYPQQMMMSDPRGNHRNNDTQQGKGLSRIELGSVSLGCDMFIYQHGNVQSGCRKCAFDANNMQAGVVPGKGFSRAEVRLVFVFQSDNLFRRRNCPVD